MYAIQNRCKRYITTLQAIVCFLLLRTLLDLLNHFFLTNFWDNFIMGFIQLFKDGRIEHQHQYLLFFYVPHDSFDGSLYFFTGNFYVSIMSFVRKVATSRAANKIVKSTWYLTGLFGASFPTNWKSFENYKTSHFQLIGIFPL